MLHGPCRLQRAILKFMQDYARSTQRTPQREHWQLDRLVLILIP